MDRGQEYPVWQQGSRPPSLWQQDSRSPCLWQQGSVGEMGRRVRREAVCEDSQLHPMEGEASEEQQGGGGEEQEGARGEQEVRNLLTMSIRKQGRRGSMVDQVQLAV